MNRQLVSSNTLGNRHVEIQLEYMAKAADKLMFCTSNGRNGIMNEP